MKTYPLLSAITLALAVASTANAEQHQYRQHDAHQHGLVDWYIAQEDSALLVEIVAPGSDVVGFEHAHENAEQKAAIEKAMSLLAEPASLLTINTEADCKLSAWQTSNTQNDDEYHAEQHSEHHDHDGHHDDENHHDDEKTGAIDSHEAHEHHDDHHDEHGHHDHHQEGNHGEFTAQYTFECAKPDAIQSLTTSWFDVFANTEQINVQAITDKGVAASALKPASRTFLF